MYRIFNADEAFLRNRRNFAFLANKSIFQGKEIIKSDELAMVEEDLLADGVIKDIFPHFVRSVTMHSQRGAIKIIQLRGKRA